MEVTPLAEPHLPAADQFLIAIGAVLRDRRTALGLTLRDITDRTTGKVHIGSLSRHERGARGMTVHRLHELATAVGHSVSSVVASAEALIEISPDDGYVLDLARLSQVRDTRLTPTARWAAASLAAGWPERLGLPAGLVDDMAAMCGLPAERLGALLRRHGVITPK